MTRSLQTELVLMSIVPPSKSSGEPNCIRFPCFYRWKSSSVSAALFKRQKNNGIHLQFERFWLEAIISRTLYLTGSGKSSYECRLPSYSSGAYHRYI
jgi:hypothetical protein